MPLQYKFRHFPWRASWALNPLFDDQKNGEGHNVIKIGRASLSENFQAYINN